MDEQLFIAALNEKNMTLNEQQVEQFSLYYDALVEWNKKVNLTAITEKEEVYLKHFYDSISPSFFYPFQSVRSICDIGAGAGFPSLPLKICFPDLRITIVDSLKKRINFLSHLVQTLQLTNVELIHSRAEDVGQNKQYREQFDVVTARAVAKLSVLSEYCIPLCKVNGSFIALKGSNSNEEMNEAEKAITTLGGELKKNQRFQLPIEESDRSIIFIQKTNQTPKKYPRKAGIPSRNPMS